MACGTIARRPNSCSFGNFSGLACIISMINLLKDVRDFDRVSCYVVLSSFRKVYIARWVIDKRRPQDQPYSSRQCISLF